MEGRFLGLVRNNDVSEVSAALRDVNINPGVCPDIGSLRDEFGRTVLELAVDSGSREVAEVLLDHGAPIGDALLYAVDRQDIGAVQNLLEKALRESLGRTYDENLEMGISAFPSYMTPVMLAAHKNNYPILKMLLQAGFPTPEPDDYQWTTSIEHSEAWLDAYRAVCSPSYILLTSDDPFRTAFRTAKALRDVCWKREQYRPELEELADQCETLSYELLGEVRTSKECGVVLGHVGSKEDHPYRKLVCTLELAVDLLQTKFVTHPLCFDYVDQRRYKELCDYSQFFRGWETKSPAYGLAVWTVTGFLYPFLCLAHLLAPRSKIGTFSSISVIRTNYWTYSWITLLILLLVVSQAYRVGPSEIDSIIKGTPEPSELISIPAMLVMVWVIDVGWKELLEARSEGLLNHFKQLWNILDSIMVALYLAQFALRLVAIYKLDVYTDQSTVADDWMRKAKENSFQPVALAEVLFSIFTIVVFMRAVSLFLFHRFLGMLMISIGRMFMDILKFIAMEGLILFAFACGLNQLYWFYGTIHEYLCSNYSQSNLQSASCSKHLGFDTLFNSLQTLFWAGFGITDLSTLELKPGTSPVDVFQMHEWPAITEGVGLATFALYHVIGVLVLINLLIAIMSDSYQRTEEMKRRDWSFSMMKHVLYYLKVDVPLPPPFTLITSIRNSLVRAVLALCRRNNNAVPSDTNVEEVVDTSQSTLSVKGDLYKVVVSRLTTRYLLRKERSVELSE